jgi:transcriptional regulator with XRE-family HTH domain
MSQAVYTKLANRIRQVRTSKGISQEELAFAAKMNRAYVGYIERCERKPTIATVAKLAKALNTSLYELFRF